MHMSATEDDEEEEGESSSMSLEPALVNVFAAAVHDLHTKIFWKKGEAPVHAKEQQGGESSSTSAMGSLLNPLMFSEEKRGRGEEG